MRRLLAIIALIISVICLPSRLLAEQHTFKVGFILPLGGEAASVGEAIKNGIVLCHERLSPKIKEQIEILFEDDQMSATNAASAFNKLTSVDHVDAVLTAFSSSGGSVAPLAERKAIPMISIASDPQIVAGRRYSVLLWVTPESEIQSMLPEIRRRGYKKVARVSSEHVGSLSGNKVFDAQNQGTTEIVLDQSFPLESKDFRLYLAKIKRRDDVDALMLTLLPGHLGTFARQMQEAGVRLPVFGWETMDDRHEIELAQGALSGAWFVSADEPSDDFLNAYRQRFPKTSIFGAANGHDALALIAEAIHRGAKNSADINLFLHKVTNFSGALGKFSASSDSRFDLPSAVKEVLPDGSIRRLRP